MEINVILSAIQSAFATSVQHAVAAATAPLVERIDALEKNEEYLTRRITALEGDISHKVQVQQANIVAALADRIAALENNPAQGVDTQAAPTTDITRHIIDALGDTDHPLFKRLSSFMDAVAEQAMDDHLGTYDHDEYDNHINDDDKHFDGDIEDAVRGALNGTSVTLSF